MQDLTTGSVARHLLKTGGFMLVTMIFHTLYILVDLYWVGRLGTEAVAAVSVSSNLMFVVLALTQMLGVGTTTVISHAAGRKDREQAIFAFNQSLALAAAAGLAFLLVTLAFHSEYARQLSADAATTALATQYLLWFIPAMALQFGLVSMSAALRGTGHFKPGAVVQTATIVMNIILTPFLIFGWVTGRPLGVTGAALATFISIAVGTVWLALYFLRSSSYLTFMPTEWRPHLRQWWAMLRIGLPAGAEFGLLAVYLVIVYAVSRPFGAAAQAGFGIGMRVLQAGFMPVVALAFAVAPVAGQNFGAGKAQRVRDTFTAAVVMATAAMVLLTVVSQVASSTMIQVFSSDARAVDVGTEYLRILSWTFVASGMAFVSSSMFQAMGNTLPALMTSGLRVVSVAIPVFYVSRLPGFELRWVWYLSAVSIVLQMAMSLWLLRREFRTRLTFALAPVA
ncbi:MAG: MATE family efflux transporter [Luteitalea sp.]|nr:MATE family efflux transporter [Luteitalea sp.]